MTKLLKYTAIAAAVFAASSAYADNASTKGGLTIKSDDGRFEATVGGRIQFDAAALNADSNQTANNENSGFYFRRVFITLKGSAYGWSYNIDEDISNINGAVVPTTVTSSSCAAAPCTVTTKVPALAAGPGAGFNDVWLAKSFGDSTIYFGQHRPWRSLDGLASNNETVFMERNALSENGIYGGRDFTDGVYYKYASNGLWLGASGYSQTKVGKGNTEGSGGNVRAAYAPINAPGSVLHIGATYSLDQFDVNATNPGYGSPTAGYSTAYSKSGAAFNVFSGFSATNVQVGTATVEALGIIGPVFLQGEYGTAKFRDRNPGTGASTTVDAYSATASWYVTGESRVYKAADGTYGAAKINGVDGAVEVAVRYDNIKNKETNAKVSAVTFGANYYFNPNVRFMVDYELGKAEKTTGLATGKTDASPSSVMARAQFAF